VSVTVV